MVDAIQWTGDNFGELTDLMHDAYGVDDKKITIPTLEGVMTAKVGDWIVKNIWTATTVFQVYKPDIFEKMYEAVEDSNAKE